MKVFLSAAGQSGDELLLSEYSKIVENVKEIEKENSTSQSKTVSLAIENQSLNNKIQEFKTKISDLNDEKVINHIQKQISLKLD